MPGTECVRVVVRVRPLNASERAKGCSSVIDVDGRDSQVSIYSSRSLPPKTFAFDAVYDPASEQQQIYDETAFPLVESVLEGYNGTIFAYGQTGCGKTFTMSGTEEKPGVIPNSFRHIFGAISDTQTTRMFLVYCSYVEIYNEEIRDLLVYDPTKKLELKENKDAGVYIKGVSKQPVSTVNDIHRFMEAGTSHRTTKETAMNERSSRSHSIFTVYVEMSEEVQGRQAIRAGKLNLVDLAGSERQKKTNASGDRLKEAIEINLSLSALGNVISALVDGHSSHIPYRDSKLTRLLQDSLGGNTKTIMIAVASPADYNYDESLSTLRYASRAKSIQNKPKINEDPKDALLRQYLEQINELKKQLAQQGERKVVIVEVPKYVRVPRKRQKEETEQQHYSEEEEMQTPQGPADQSSSGEEIDARPVHKKQSKSSIKPSPNPVSAAPKQASGNREKPVKNARNKEKSRQDELGEYRSLSPARKPAKDPKKAPEDEIFPEKTQKSRGTAPDLRLQSAEIQLEDEKYEEIYSDSDEYGDDFEAENSIRMQKTIKTGKRKEKSTKIRQKVEFEQEESYENDFEQSESAVKSAISPVIKGKKPEKSAKIRLKSPKMPSEIVEIDGKTGDYEDDFDGKVTNSIQLHKKRGKVKPASKPSEKLSLVGSESVKELRGESRQGGTGESEEMGGYPEDFEDKEALVELIGKKVLQGGQTQGQGELADLRRYHENQVKKQKEVQSRPKAAQPSSTLSTTRFNSVSEEVTTQRSQLKSLQTQYKTALMEIQDLNHEHEMAKEDLLAGIRSKDHEVGFLCKVLELLLTPEQLNSIKEKAEFDEEGNEWSVPDFVLEKNNPVSFPKLQRRGEDLGEVKGKVIKLSEREEDLMRNAKFQDWKKPKEKRGEDRWEDAGRGGALKAVMLDPLEQAPVPFPATDNPHSRKRLLKPLPEERKRSYIS